MKNNYVAKNDFNKSSVHKDKKNDYTRENLGLNWVVWNEISSEDWSVEDYQKILNRLAEEATEISIQEYSRAKWG